jgi:hypothetical protein
MVFPVLRRWAAKYLTNAKGNNGEAISVLVSRRKVRIGAAFPHLRPAIERLEDRNLPSFVSAISSPVFGPDQAAFGDFNGDGNLDFAAPFANSVNIYLGRGDGTFQQGASMVVREGPKPIAVGDFNGDGKLDLAVGTATGVSILLGNGDGTFQAPVQYSTGNNNQSNLIVLDVDRDGTLDIITTDSLSFSIKILLGNGDGTFRPGQQLTGAFGLLTSGDFNNDGNVDLAVSGGNLTVYYGNGDGTFHIDPIISLRAESNAIAAGDLNSDGKTDLVVAEGTSFQPNNFIQVFLGNGDGTFQSPISYTVGESPDSIAIADLNGDGRVDLAIANESNDVSVLLGNGDGTFRIPTNYVSGVIPVSLAVADFNHDGKLDLATVNGGAAIGGGGTIGVLLGNGDGTFQGGLDVDAGLPASSVGVGDLNGDGKLDVVVADPFESQVNVFLRNSDGTFRPPVAYSADFPNWVALADLNGDGILDLVTLDYSNNSVRVFMGKGDGTFGAPVDFPAGSNPKAVKVADLNNDGIPDIIESGSGATVLLGNGDGTFRAPMTIQGASGNYQAPVAADFNNDGILDLVLNGQIFFGNGDGTFGPPINLFNRPFFAPPMTAADLNGDGNRDLVFTDGADVEVMLGNGDGTFQSPVSYVADNGVGAVLVGDVTGDGIPDILTVNGAASELWVFDGNGDGSFRPGIKYVTGSGPQALALGDMDGNGLPDVVMADSGSHFSTFTVLLNAFAPTTLTPSSIAEGSGDFTLTVRGGPFSTMSTVEWNGMPLPTTFVNSSELQATVPAADVVDEGTANITITGSGEVPPSQFSILDNDALSGAGYQINPTEGQAFNAIVATFTDVTYPSNSPNDFEATIDWGDGSTSSGTITAAGNGLFEVRGSHTYSEQGDFSITVQIRDPGSVAAATIHSTASVAAGSSQLPDDLVGRASQSGQWWVSLSNGSNAFTSSLFATWSSSTTWVDVLTGDFNGDGRTDIAARDANTGAWWVGLSTGSSFTTSLWTIWNTAATWVDVQVGDFTGDGKADIVGRVLQTGQWWVAQSTGSSFTNSLWATWSASATWADVKVGDFNGDGKADITGRWLQGGSWWTGVSTGSSFTTSMWAAWSTGVTWVDVQVGDFNGDGKSDITGRVLETGQWWTGLSTGSSFSTSLWTTWNAAVTWVDVKVGDFNGDGKSDIIGRVLETGQWWAGISTGSTFTNSLWSTWSTGVTWVDVQVGDFNGDGKSDITGRALETGQWWTGLSNGSAFTNSLWATWSTSVTWTGVRTGDFA